MNMSNPVKKYVNENLTAFDLNDVLCLSTHI